MVPFVKTITASVGRGRNVPAPVQLPHVDLAGSENPGTGWRGNPYGRLLSFRASLSSFFCSQPFARYWSPLLS